MGLTPLEIGDSMLGHSSSDADARDRGRFLTGLIPLETKHTGRSAPCEEMDPRNSDNSLTGKIGYTCSYTPVEIVSATGFRPYRLLHGDIGRSSAGEQYVRIDSCPLVRSNIRYLVENKDDFVAIVGSTGCDMARRMFEVVAYETKLPTFLFNNPRTDNQLMFNDEIDWLVQELKRFSGRDLSDQALAQEIDRWEGARSVFRGLDAKRRSRPSMVSTTRLHQAAMSYHQGEPDAAREVPEETSDRPRIYLIGSPISYESNSILSRIEEQLHIVGDFNCGISRFANLKIDEPNLNGIKNAYYNQPPCIFKRPNNKFYEWISTEIRSLNCVGVVAWTLDYCDSFEFELNRIERAIGLPMLRLKSDFSVQNLGQLKTRIGAFAEMLRS